MDLCFLKRKLQMVNKMALNFIILIKVLNFFFTGKIKILNPNKESMADGHRHFIMYNRNGNEINLMVI